MLYFGLVGNEQITTLAVSIGIVESQPMASKPNNGQAQARWAEGMTIVQRKVDATSDSGKTINLVDAFWVYGLFVSSFEFSFFI